MKPVPVDMVTGFLGAGKTTLISQVLGGGLAAERVAVIVNEIGDVSVDGRVIRGLEHVESMVELDSGCICCTIDDYRFDMAIQELVDRADPTLIVIETSGAADPRTVRERIARAGLPLDAIITVVDAANVRRAWRETAVARAQVATADFLVINKVDLIAAAERPRLSRQLRRRNRRAALFESEHGRVPTDVLFATAARRYREGALARDAGGYPCGEPADSGASGRDAIAAFSWSGNRALDRSRFERFLSRLPASIYRAKGFVRFRMHSWSCLFNYTCGRYELNWIQLPDAPAPVQAVFIGRDIESARDGIERALSACEAR